MATILIYILVVKLLSSHEFRPSDQVQVQTHQSHIYNKIIVAPTKTILTM
jgi:hypothetical protein